jgi:periplasmic protein TonB
MPRTMFTEVVSSCAGPGRKWYTVALSLMVHSAVFTALIVAPLVATGELPLPSSLMPSYIIADVVPSPPPVVTARRPEVPAPTGDPHLAPIDAPTAIGAETGIVQDREMIQTGAVDNLVLGLGTAAVAIEPPPPMASAPPDPVRPGGDIKPPTRVRNAQPVYPFIAKQNRIQGIVIIEAIIGTDGRVEDAKVIRSIPLLDQAALDAVKAWEYTPTLLNGRPTPVIMTVTVHFKLSD